MERYVKDMPSSELSYFNNLFSPPKSKPTQLLLKEPVKPTFKKFPEEPQADPTPAAAQTPLVPDKPQQTAQRKKSLLGQPTFSADRKQALPPHKFPDDTGL